MDMQCTPKSPKIFESNELSNKFSTNLDMYLFFIEICGNNLFRRVFHFFLMTRSWVHVLICISIKKGYLPNPMKGQQWTVYIRTGSYFVKRKLIMLP